MIKADIWRRCKLSGKEIVRLKQIENLLPFLADFAIIRRIYGEAFPLNPAMTTGFAPAINEILLNIIKHAFNDNRARGTIGPIW